MLCAVGSEAIDGGGSLAVERAMGVVEVERVGLLHRGGVDRVWIACY